MPDKNSKTSSPLKLADIARELRRIADDLEKQTFATGAGKISVTEPTFFKTRSELKGDKAYFSLSIKMGLGDGTTHTPQRKKSAKTKAPAKQRSSGSGEAKKTKKEINRLWKNLRRQIEKREQTNPSDSNELLRLWEDYTLFAEPSWSDAWRECKKEVEQCLRSASSNDWQRAETAVKEVIRLTKECHKQHK